MGAGQGLRRTVRSKPTPTGDDGLEYYYSMLCRHAKSAASAGGRLRVAMEDDQTGSEPELGEVRHPSRALDPGGSSNVEAVRMLGIVVMVGVLIISACGTDGGQTDLEPGEPAEQTTGAVAFASDRDGDFEIYVIRDDGSSVVQLTDNSADDLSPAWSPDGTRIAFASDRNDDYDIYTMDANGTNQTRNTDGLADEFGPVWSPDGRRIAFESERDGNTDIHIMSADGSGAVPVAASPSDEISPDWSPDGNHITFTSDRDGDFDIYVMDTDGSNVTRVTDDSWQNLSPDWSPDGSVLAFQTDREGSFDIFLARRQSAAWQISPLIATALDDAEPDWAEAGELLMFTRNFGGGLDIFVSGADGSGARPLVDAIGDDVTPAWTSSVSWGSIEPTPD